MAPASLPRNPGSLYPRSSQDLSLSVLLEEQVLLSFLLVPSWFWFGLLLLLKKKYIYIEKRLFPAVLGEFCQVLFTEHLWLVFLTAPLSLLVVTG